MSQSPTIISQSLELEEDRNIIKIIGLGLIGIALCFATVYFFNKFLLGVHYLDLLWSLIAAGGFLIVTVVEVFLIKSLAKLNFIIFLEVLTALTIFYEHLYPKISLPLALGALAFFIFLSLGAGQGLKLLSNSVKIQSVLTAKLVIPKAVTGLLIFLSVLLYLNYFEWGKFTDEMGQSLLTQFLTVSKPAFKFLAPNFSPNQSVKEFFFAVSENQLRKLGRGELKDVIPNFEYDFIELPLEMKNQLIEETAEQLKLSVEKIVGPLNWKDSVGRAFFMTAKNYISNLPVKFKSTFGIGLALLFFVSIKGIAVLFYWFIELLVLLIMKFLLVTGFAYVSIENRSREFILLK